MKTLLLLTGLLLAAAPVDAQSVATLKKELRQKQSTAGKDVEALLEVAKWAEEKGLVSDRRKVLNSILKIDPENVEAHDMLGFEKFDGDWVTKSKAQMLRRKALEAEMKAKGYTQTGGVWVSKEELDDAKKGIFWHDGKRVSKADKLALAAGKVRHGVTGEWIDATDADKADQGLFPFGSDRWADEKAADQYHSNPETPWLFRTHYATLVSCRPLAELKAMSSDFDSAFDTAKRVFDGVEPSLAHRPVIHIATTADEYRELGNAIGAEGSAYAVFRSIADVEQRSLGTIRPIVMNWDKDWGPYWLRHAAGLAYVSAVLRDLDAEAPLWFERGVAGYAERHYNPGAASWFGKQHLEKGGVRDLKSWFERFEVSANITPRMLDYNMYQAGLVLDFAMNGGDEDALKAMQAVGKAAAKGSKGNDLSRAIQQLERVLSKKEDEIREWLRKITSN